MYIFGASGHGKVIASILQAANLDVVGFIDDNPQSAVLYWLPVFHSNEFLKLKVTEMIIGIGDNLHRKNCALKYRANYRTVIHPSAIINSSVTIMEGTVVMPNVVVNVAASIGKHCIINTGAIIEHDCVLEDFVHISPRVALAGGVTVGEGTHIGIGASVIPGIDIGKWVVIGAGAVITENVPDGAVVVGVPGKIIKTKSIQ